MRTRVANKNGTIWGGGGQPWTCPRVDVHGLSMVDCHTVDMDVVVVVAVWFLMYPVFLERWCASCFF